MIENTPKITFDNSIISNLNEPKIMAKIKDINNSYLYWDKVKYKKVDGLSPEELWNTIKLVRNINYKQIKFSNVIFNYFNTDYIQKSLHEFDMNIGGYMGSQKIIPESDKARYLVSSIMEEAISSSIMEGANTTRKKAKDMLRKDTKPINKSEQMIVNNYSTIKHILKNKSEELTSENLLQIHKLMTKNTLKNENEEGTFRESNDIYVINYSTSEIVHTPPQYNEINKLIKELCQFFNSEKEDFIHPIVKGIIIHFMIGWIHPFTDGNGRTARALFYWYLLKKGYWLTEYLSISKIIQGSKNQYEKAYLYTENDSNDLSYFITYHIEVMHKAFDSLKKHIQEKQQENLQIASFIKIPNINERQAQILKTLYDEPECVFSVKEVQNRFSIANYTARTDLNNLVNMGYMEMISVNKVKQNYIRSLNFNELIKA
jgi:Fic family protein